MCIDVDVDVQMYFEWIYIETANERLMYLIIQRIRYVLAYGMLIWYWT